MADMERHEIHAAVRALKASDVPRLDWRELLKESEESRLSEADRDVLATYFGRFMATPTNDKGQKVCPCCRMVQRSGIEGALLGGAPGSTTLEWSLAHGEAHCRVCTWPYRVYHYDIGGAGADALIQSLTCALAVHPSEIELREEVAAEAHS